MSGDEFAQGRQCLPAVHARHGQIAKDERISSRCCRNTSTASTPSFASSTVKPRCVSMALGHFAHALLVFDQQHRAAPFHLREVEAALFPAGGGLLPPDTGKKTRKTLPRPGSLSTVTAPPCARTIPRTTDRPSAPAGELGGEKRVEDLLDILVLQSRSPRPPLPGRHRHCPAAASRWETVHGGDIRRGNRFDGQVNGAPALTDSLPGIGDQVGQDLLYLVRVRADDRTGGGQIGLQDHVFRNDGPKQGRLRRQASDRSSGSRLPGV